MRKIEEVEIMVLESMRWNPFRITSEPESQIPKRAADAALIHEIGDANVSDVTLIIAESV